MKLDVINSILILLFLSIDIFPQSGFIQAVDFDGSGDYANTFNNPYLPTPNGTIEAWLKVRSILPPGGSEGEAFFAKNEEQWNLGDHYSFFDYSTGKLKSRIQASPSFQIDIQSNNNFQSSGEWFHYAFTWGTGGMKMYINGELQNNQNNLLYSALNNTYNIYVGAHGYMQHNGTYVVSDFFDGQIDELRIWNYQKNSQQILALKNAPLDSTYYTTIDSGLVGYWKFDVLEDLGINNDGVDDIRDFSVFHNHLDLAGDAHLVSPDPIIPVELSSFFAETINGSVQLSWSTLTEINNFGFEIEKTFENTEFHTIAFIKGAGTTTEFREYTYTDTRVEPGKYFYRLKQIDFNGSFDYSDAIEVEVLQPSKFKLEQNYPNPFNPTTTIEYSIPERQFVTLRVYDALGQMVSELVNGETEAGNYELIFDAAGLPSGTYFYQLTSGKYQMTNKMILLK